MMRATIAIAPVRRHPGAGSSLINAISAVVGVGDDPIDASRMRSKRRQPASVLRANRLTCQSRRHLSRLVSPSHNLYSINLRGGSTLGVALPQIRMYSVSCTRLNRPPSTSDGSKYEGSKDRSGTREDSTTEGESTETAAINQRATNAILSQLSSPPNILTVSRMLATPYLSYLLISQHNLTEASGVVGNGNTAAAVLDATTETATAADALSSVSGSIDPTSAPVVALTLFLAMGFTDFLDGYIARTFPSTATVLGTYLDPFADKFFISVMSLTLWHTGILPGALVGLWVARDVGIVGSVYWLVRQETIRKRSSANKGGDGDGENIAVMDPKKTPLKVQASLLSKVNTTLQIGLIALGIAGEVPQIDIPPELMTSLIWITAGTTIGSSLGYLDGSALMKSGNKN